MIWHRKWDIVFYQHYWEVCFSHYNILVQVWLYRQQEETRHFVALTSCSKQFIVFFTFTVSFHVVYATVADAEMHTAYGAVHLESPSITFLNPFIFFLKFCTVTCIITNF